MEFREKIIRYCQYQERCQYEVTQKLYSFSLGKEDIDSLLYDVLALGLVDEERYAINFARGKFRLKSWGRQKIINELKLKKISDYCIKKALKLIEEEDYKQTIHALAQKKWKLLSKEKNIMLRKNKLYRYLIQKGYESDIISLSIQELVDI